MASDEQIQEATEQVLIVDNEDFVLQALERLFYGELFGTLTAASAEEAMQILQHEDISVLVTDNEMSGLTGLDLLVWARKSCPETVRIMLTGYAEVETVVRAVNQAEVFRFFIKPCDFGELKSVVNEALALRRARRKSLAKSKVLEQEVFFHEYLRQHCETFEQAWSDFQERWAQSGAGLVDSPLE